MDSGEEHLVQCQVRLPVCSYRIAGLEPRLFSFNSPPGACRPAMVIGHVDVIDAQRVVAFPGLSLSSGAVKGWDRRNGYFFAAANRSASIMPVDVDAPFDSCRKRCAR